VIAWAAQGEFGGQELVRGLVTGLAQRCRVTAFRPEPEQAPSRRLGQVVREYMVVRCCQRVSSEGGGGFLATAVPLAP
jgi:hypothetical protein